MRKNFDFKWKLVENYSMAAIGGVFLWFFVNGIVNSSMTDLAVSIAILSVAPFLITYVDKKSSGN